MTRSGRAGPPWATWAAAPTTWPSSATWASRPRAFRPRGVQGHLLPLGVRRPHLVQEGRGRRLRARRVMVTEVTALWRPAPRERGHPASRSPRPTASTVPRHAEAARSSARGAASPRRTSAGSKPRRDASRGSARAARDGWLADLEAGRLCDDALARINARLLRADRLWAVPAGLPGRPWYKGRLRIARRRLGLRLVGAAAAAAAAGARRSAGLRSGPRSRTSTCSEAARGAGGLAARPRSAHPGHDRGPFGPRQPVRQEPGHRRVVRPRRGRPRSHRQHDQARDPGRGLRASGGRPSPLGGADPAHPGECRRGSRDPRRAGPRARPHPARRGPPDDRGQRQHGHEPGARPGDRGGGQRADGPARPGRDPLAAQDRRGSAQPGRRRPREPAVRARRLDAARDGGAPREAGARERSSRRRPRARCSRS